ncbi:hypothetical protein AFCDBAGC_4890 [Methylobacterium cerastii]|uniref:Bacteriophage protein n=1 Tax=Methylobacterium cerastii TaxID=932741 RepID=A0ABQ4QQB6_9HYPH|nr:hypothetical protein [Methylobacterium cerastii]GJD47005.1 hypothetical protein AFCDBAGC_4890 [Methylobacterium cerastii]
MPVKRGKDLTYELERTLRDLASMEVVVGIPAEAGTHADSGLTNAALGYIHEFGAPEANIPARPFLFPGIERIQDKIADKLAKGGARAVEATVASGNRTTGKAEGQKALQRVGILAQNSVRGVITDGIAPPLSARTVYDRLHRKKNRRSPGPMTPLVDTGKLREAITYIVRPKED